MRKKRLDALSPSADASARMHNSDGVLKINQHTTESSSREKRKLVTPIKMSKRKQKENTDQRPLASFGFKGDGRSIAKTSRPTDQPGPSTTRREKGGTSSAQPSEKKKSDCEQAKNFQEKWLLEFPWL